MKAVIGVESDLLHISDDEIVWIIEQWKRIHPPRDADDKPGTDYFDAVRVEKMKEEAAVRIEVVDEIEWRLNSDKLAEIEAIFYLGRDGLFPEFYERRVDLAKREHIAANDREAEIMHLMDKTNFLTSVRLAAAELGREHGQYSRCGKHTASENGEFDFPDRTSGSVCVRDSRSSRPSWTALSNTGRSEQSLTI